MYTSLQSFNSSSGTFTKSLATRSDLVQVVFPFNAATFLPQILSAVSMCLTVTGQSLIWLLDLLLHEACLILTDSINKSKIAISGIKIM